MNKAAAFGSVGILGAAASAGGVYLSKMGNFDSELPEDFSKFEEKGHEEGCVQSLFSGLKELKVTEGDGTDKIDNNFFDAEDKKKTSGCLVINWHKENYANGNDSKWKGGFRLLWSIRNAKDNKGLVVFAAADPIAGSKMKWKGAAYALDKKDKDWKVSKKLSVDATGKDVEANGKFPKAKSIKPPYWGYLEEPKGDMSKFCTDDNACPATQKKPDTSFAGYWTWEGIEESKEGSESVGDWMENLEEWWKGVFGEDKGKIKELINDVKGKWTERVWYGIDKQTT